MGGDICDSAVAVLPPLLAGRETKTPNLTLNDINDSLLIEILHRLPCPKSALRCKLVSKRWRSLISEPYFITRFLHHHIKKPKLSTLLIYFCFKIDQNMVFRISGDPQFRHGRGFRFRELPRRNRGRVLASCYDLVLCYEDNLARNEDVYWICNPLTPDQWIELPPPPRKYRTNSTTQILVGFSCDPYYRINNNNSRSGDHHAVINSQCRYSVVRIPDIPGSSIAEIFSSETNKWSTINLSCGPQDFGEVPVWNTNAVPCNGMLHWLTLEKIVAYNPYNIKQCHVICFPNDAMKQYSLKQQETYYCLGVLNGTSSLRLLQLTMFSRTLDFKQGHDHNVKVWELEDYVTGKWNLMHDVFLDSMTMENPWIERYLKGCRSISARKRPLAIHPIDGDIVYLHVDDKIVLCNMKTRELVQSGNDVYQTCLPSRFVFNVFPFVIPLWPTPLPALQGSLQFAKSANEKKRKRC